jgi:two-component system, LytTR family, response regulator
MSIDLVFSSPAERSLESRRLVFRTGRRVFFVPPDGIRWIGAEGNYSRVHIDGTTFLVRELIGSLEARLTSLGFVRIHRSAIVNARAVTEIRRVTRHRLVAVLNDGTEVRLAHEYRASLERYLSVH